MVYRRNIWNRHIGNIDKLHNGDIEISWIYSRKYARWAILQEYWENKKLKVSTQYIDFNNKIDRGNKCAATRTYVSKSDKDVKIQGQEYTHTRTHTTSGNSW
jgi:hypothetical protein